MRAWARFALSEYADRPWRALDHAIRTGENVFQHQFGTDIWSFRIGSSGLFEPVR